MNTDKQCIINRHFISRSKRRRHKLNHRKCSTDARAVKVDEDPFVNDRDGMYEALPLSTDPPLRRPKEGSPPAISSKSPSTSYQK